MDSASPARKRWNLTEAAFDRLLANLDSDRQRAGEKYRLLHRRLEKYFEFHRCSGPEDLADETLNRVARKLEEGEAILSISSYSLGVGRVLLKESYREQFKRVSIDPGLASPPGGQSAVLESHLECLEACLQNLPAETRYLIVQYYQLIKQAKIDHRRLLAEQLGIPINALRIRAHRIRSRIEECVKDCLRKS